jgi:hypothetical protein
MPGFRQPDCANARWKFKGVFVSVDAHPCSYACTRFLWKMFIRMFHILGTKEYIILEDNKLYNFRLFFCKLLILFERHFSYPFYKIMSIFQDVDQISLSPNLLKCPESEFISLLSPHTTIASSFCLNSLMCLSDDKLLCKDRYIF